MAIGLTEVVNQVMGRIAASYGAANYGVLVETERFPSGEISDACVDGDCQACGIMLQSKHNSHRLPFLSIVTVAHGAQIPDHIGDVDSIQIGGQYAEPTSPARIAAERANALGITYVPKYFLDGDTLYHNGAGTASVTIATFHRNNSVLQAPDEYAGAVIAWAAGMLIGKNGNKMDAAQGYMKFWDMCIGPISKGGSIPNLPSPQAMAQGQQGGIPMGAIEG